MPKKNFSPFLVLDRPHIKQLSPQKKIALENAKKKDFSSFLVWDRPHIKHL